MIKVSQKVWFQSGQKYILKLVFSQSYTALRNSYCPRFGVLIRLCILSISCWKLCNHVYSVHHGMCRDLWHEIGDIKTSQCPITKWMNDTTIIIWFTHILYDKLCNYIVLTDYFYMCIFLRDFWMHIFQGQRPKSRIENYSNLSQVREIY